MSAPMTPEQVRAEVTAEFVAWLVKKAREHRAKGPQYAKQADVIARLADKVSRGAVRPNNLLSLPPQGGPEDAVLAEQTRRPRRFTPLEEAVQGIETAIAPLTGDQRAGADMVLAYLRTLTTPDTTVPRDLRPGAETARRMIADRQTAEDPFPGACEACGETDAQWCPDCAACRKGCHGGHEDNTCTHPNAPWSVTS
ncbi:hypothetical protein RKD45_002463 [Streptomyces griseus]